MPKYQQDRDIAWRSVDGEAVLVDPVARELRVLNPVGTVVWAALETPRTLDELVKEITAAFDVGPEKARADLDAFLAALRSKKLLREIPD